MKIAGSPTCAAKSKNSHDNEHSKKKKSRCGVSLIFCCPHHFFALVSRCSKNIDLRDTLPFTWGWRNNSCKLTSCIRVPFSCCGMHFFTLVPSRKCVDDSRPVSCVRMCICAVCESGFMSLKSCLLSCFSKRQTSAYAGRLAAEQRHVLFGHSVCKVFEGTASNTIGINIVIIPP